MIIVKGKNLTKHFGEVRALPNLSFEILLLNYYFSISAFENIEIMIGQSNVQIL